MFHSSENVEVSWIISGFDDFYDKTSSLISKDFSLDIANLLLTS